MKIPKALFTSCILIILILHGITHDYLESIVIQIFHNVRKNKIFNIPIGSERSNQWKIAFILTSYIVSSNRFKIFRSRRTDKVMASILCGKTNMDSGQIHEIWRILKFSVTLLQI